jgi:protein-S-isoprenylcysteine O-methyltransferase Ste14
MTVNLLTVYGLFSLYLYVGSFHEEHRLLQQFGPAYRAYKERVGRFLPHSGPTAYHQLRKTDPEQ